MKRLFVCIFLVAIMSLGLDGTLCAAEPDGGAAQITDIQFLRKTEIADADFVMSVYDLLVENYYDPKLLKPTALLNAALSGIRRELKKHDVVFEPARLSGPIAEVRANFRKEFARALALSAENKLDKNLCGFAAANCMLASLNDSHTWFTPPAGPAKTVLDKLPGGIGMVLAWWNNIYFVNLVVSGSPAEKAGVKRLDRLMAVDGKNVLGETGIDDVVRLLRGAIGTTVEVGMERNGAPMTFRLQREKIPADLELPYKMEPIRGPGGNTFLYFPVYEFILIETFGRQTILLPADFWSLHESLDAKGVILDLRNNGGGNLEAVKYLAGMFFDKPFGLGNLSRRHKTEEILIFPRSAAGAKSQPLRREHTPMVVLIDEGSASGSEIVAAALKEYGRAKLVGTISAGATNVAKTFLAGCGAFAKITIDEYATPVCDRKIEHWGVYPDYYVELTLGDILMGRDSQLQKALEVLEKEAAVREKNGQAAQTQSVQTQPASAQ